MNTFKTCLSGLALSVACASATAGEVEVLHWWTSGGEAAAINVLKQEMEAAGHTWKDFAVAGGGGESAMTVLKSRAISGNPPSAAQIKGPDIQEWGELGFLAPLDEVAGAGQWDSLLPEVVSNVMKYDGHYVAVPINVHRVNWLWANPAAFEKAGVEIPTTWEQMIEVGSKLREAGFVPLAHGGQAWQDATLYEAVALAEGPEFYRKAFVDHDEATLKGETMVKVLKTFKQMRELIDDDASGRDWNVATSMVINGEAAMQVMGDWAKGEFTAAGKVAGSDYVCAPAPGTADMFTFNIDSLAMFQQSDDSRVEAQQDLARLAMEPKFQEAFNLNKGSIPARQGMDRTPFDSCAHASMDAFTASAEKGSLVPSMAHGMATVSRVQGAIYDVVTNFFNSTDMSAEEAADKLARAVNASL
ncbi:sugar ABC transporter substrate-binding protein [Marinobacterium nitratireducens]|uniref:Probable sugar-binding periplasmic protein n=1 Tax=Marinobacterium nitratireducens TaxID=518897 RepID=A0A918DWI5_9GAMM|nr:ABC transporter substrate-binding protein [Marinobacterium nitratireducens]GGO85728.1 sugar ABC transporter substrate-binding protein [Marinobacterium nitratireducens]